MSDFVLNIYTPNGVVIRDLSCSQLTIPTVKGEINVLPGHTHILSEIDTGVLSVVCDGKKRHFSMTAGLLKVLGDKVTILSTTSEKSEDIDFERARAAKVKAESKLQGNEPLTDVDLIKFQRKLARANTRLRLSERASQLV